MGQGSNAARKGALPGMTWDAIIPGTTQQRTFSSVSAQSAAFASTTTIIEVFATADCFLLFGTSPTALTTSIFLPAGVTRYYGVTPAQKVAAIQSTGAGTLYITEGA